MYNEFYRFKENPFNITADPEFFFSSKSHREGLSSLMYGIEQRKGIILITGEIGTGKTTLSRKLLNKSDQKTKLIFTENLNFTEIELLQKILLELRIKIKDHNKIHLLHTLNQYLTKQTRKGKTFALVVDEAQNLSIEQLEQIRLLSNLETDKHKLLQIILIGQPELKLKLDSPELRQLRQRIAIHYHIDPLEKDDIQYYINHRVTKAASATNYAFHVTFTEEAIESIFKYTQGTPRSINILCDRALLAGYVEEKHLIDEAIIDNCAKEILNCERYS